MNDYRVISGGTSIGFQTPAEAWGYILRTGIYPVQYNDPDSVRMVYSAEADSLPIEEAGPSIRCYNVLRRGGALTWGDVHDLALWHQLPTVRNLGKKSLKETYAILRQLYPKEKYELLRWEAIDLGYPIEPDPDEDSIEFSLGEED